jgi:hypothetical protein
MQLMQCCVPQLLFTSPILSCFTCAYTLFRLSYIDAERWNGPRYANSAILKTRHFMLAKMQQTACSSLVLYRQWFEQRACGLNLLSYGWGWGP